MSDIDDMAKHFAEFVESFCSEEAEEWFDERLPKDHQGVGALCAVMGPVVAGLVEYGVDPLTIGFLAYFTSTQMATIQEKLGQS